MGEIIDKRDTKNVALKPGPIDASYRNKIFKLLFVLHVLLYIFNT